MPQRDELSVKQSSHQLNPCTGLPEQKMEMEKTTCHMNLRSVVIDGENVARTYGHQTKCDWKGVAGTILYFLQLRHRVMAVLPHWAQSEVEGTPELSSLTDHIEYSPHRSVAGSTVKSGDDLFILETARATGSVVVSNASFKDHYNNYPELRDVIANRVLSYGFVDGKLIVPLDPLEKNGSRLEQFLQH